MIGDIHVHSSFSADSDEDMEESVKAAIRAGLPCLCFTDHIDWDYPEKELVFDFDRKKYFERIRELQEKYAGQMKILAGVELGMQPQLGPRYQKLLKEWPFDYCIGSQHLVGGRDPWYPDAFGEESDAEIFRKYFEETLQNVKLFHDFDSMGHLDYIVRYGRRKAHDYSYRAYADIIDEILKLLVRYNIALEINTAGLRKQLGFPNPHPDVLRRYRELGGTLVTAGSDSHKAYSIGYAFDTAGQILKECGFTHYVYFEKREPRFVKL
ncbi:MAG: histidinol-phosphatase HisJ family protein [Eubacteriales bacterium]|jgi:histidinol-phosphatase (PHP family)|nr:histidinol-phosphatase HisJ family protein [Lachnospiraceae bacterium]MDD5858881.1 histidinol-phosphatase HisJ family protein [Eubacteriales bacterium]MCH4064818.1 histidinol-phosphatase HisJ family protein [Lachnospiraceae bacterium]MCH4103794.1 histidinol-phosphatase HisJ family protein [Lachnospiraceae bacterium]MCI1308222.1 histidinol-phosphatase HisJ family protein [Lachnospiraceae bacterium]